METQVRPGGKTLIAPVPPQSSASRCFEAWPSVWPQLVYPCGSGGNAEKALGIRIRETFETQGSVLGNFVLKVHGLLNTKTGDLKAGSGCLSPRTNPGLGRHPRCICW